MAESQSALFQTVLSRLLESFAPDILDAIYDFESILADPTNKKTPDQILEFIFRTFPRGTSQYTPTIETLLKVVECNPVRILNEQAKGFKTLMKTGQGTLLTTIKGLTKPMEKMHHKKLLFYFAMVFQSDLISQIVVNCPSSDAVPILSHCGYYLYNFEPSLPMAFDMVLDQWSVIFSVISEAHFGDVAKRFESFSETNKDTYAFLLVKYVRLDLNETVAGDFLADVASMLTYNLRKRTLTSAILASAANLLISAPDSCAEHMNKIVEIAWAVKEDRMLKAGALDILAVGFSRLDSIRQKRETFYREKVFSKTHRPEKVKHCLELFMKWIFGTEIDPTWWFWEWGVKPRADPLAFIKWNSQKGRNMNDSESFMSIFMKYFFDKADFSVCPELFCDVLLVFASADFAYFTETVVPKFLKLEMTDPRFSTMLMALPKIASPGFRENAISPITDEQIAAINLVFRPIILEAMMTITPEQNHAICISDVDANLKNTISVADQKVLEILEDWKINEFREIRFEHLRSEKLPRSLSLEVQLIKCGSVVLQKEDLNSAKVMELMLQLSFSTNQTIASEALANCRKMIDSVNFVHVILQYLRAPPSAESLFICLSLLNDFLKVKSDDCEKELLWDIELVCIIGLTSCHPATRHLTMQVLEALNDRLEQKGLISYVLPNTATMEVVVKRKIVRAGVPEKPITHSMLPLGELKYLSVFYSHFFDLWLMFLGEIANIMVLANYTPLLTRVTHNLKKYELSSESNVGLLLFICSCVGNPTMSSAIEQYTVQPFQENYETFEDNKSVVAAIFRSLLSRDSGQLAFVFVKNINLSAYQIVIDLLSAVKLEQIAGATDALYYILRNPDISHQYMREMLPGVMNFLSILQGYFTSMKANGPRVIRWTPEAELCVSDLKILAIQYCVINIQCFSHISEELTEEEWCMSSREVAFRFLVNWAMTTSEDLQGVRAYARLALGAIAHTGRLFTDSLLFDSSAVRLFSSIEAQGTKILNDMLLFHVELLLERFIETCYVEPRSTEDFFFDAIFVAFAKKNVDLVRKLTGELILLGLVYHRIGHRRAEQYLTAFTELVKGRKTSIENIHQDLRYATEVVIEAGLEVFRYPKIYVPKKDVIACLKPWISNLRLLPGQKNCVPGIPEEYHRYAPYQFLVALMEVTEVIGDDGFGELSQLWSELMRSKDHQDLVPLFLCEWRNHESKSKIFRHLIAGDAPNIVKRLASHCTFAYYYHVTASLAKDWEDELWVVPFITEAYKKENDELIQYIPVILHFAFLCFDSGDTELLDVLARKFSIELPNNFKRIEDLVTTVREFVDRMGQTPESDIECWGMEALRWLFGCQTLRKAYLSLTIYNELMKPMESLVVTGICKAVTFHVVNSRENEKLLTDLIAQAFRFYLAVFDDNRQYAFSFASCFLDCKLFVDTCLSSAVQLFIKSLSTTAVNKEAWGSIIGIVRPLLSKVETDRQAQAIFELLINVSKSQELMMIVTPVKASHPELFASILPPLEELMPTVSETVMCKSLVHYSVMLATASTSLLDSIFHISSLIVQKVVDENNRNSLAKIYKFALNNLDVCPYATEFIRVIAEREPSVATKSVFEFYDWDRSIEDVCRSLGRMLIEEETMITLTDFATLESVYNLLNSDVVPKVLPFTAQREMLDGMMRVTGSANLRKKSFRRSSYSFGIKEAGAPSSQISEPLAITCHLDPLRKPTELTVKPDIFAENWKCQLVMNPEEFLSIPDTIY